MPGSYRSVVAAQPSPRAGARRTVLLVDDDEDLRATLQEVLEIAGYYVLPASDGREALALFRGNEGTVGAAVLDLVMPGMGGEETLHELRRLRTDLPVIILSGCVGPEDADRFLSQGAVVLEKPCRLERFIQEVSQALAPLPLPS